MSLSFIAGLIAGILSGLLPGLHANTIISIFSPFFSSSEMVFFIIALFPIHMLVSYIPSIFFGVPEEGTVLSVLPGQRMVREGRGWTALKTVLASSFIAALLSVVIFYPALYFFPIAYAAIREHIAAILLFLTGILIIRTKHPHLSLLFFIASGLIGAYSLRLKLVDPFFPLFSGLFAMGAIFNYIPGRIPEQKDEKLDFSFLPFTFVGVIAGLLADLFPGISSPSQVAVLFTLFIPVSTLSYLAAVSSISTSEAIFTLATAASIDKARMGTTAMLAKHLPIEKNLLLLLVLFLVGMVIAMVIIFLLRRFIVKLAAIDFTHFNMLMAIYLFLMAILVNGLAALPIIIIASLIGFLAIRMDVERTMLMGAVIVPTLLLMFRIFI